MVLIKITSDNFDGALLTVKAYEEVVLQMSTGDVATHEASPYVCPEDFAPTHYEWCSDLDELIVMATSHQEWKPELAA